MSNVAATQPCPIPLGWTVRVCRSTRREGLAIHAQHESGREFTTEMHTDPMPDDAVVEVTLPTGERRIVTDTINIHISEEARLAFLWARAVERMRKEDAQ